MSNGKHISSLSDEVNGFPRRTEPIDILTIILVILGIVGNIFGLLIFSSSRRFRRISTVYVHLATYSSITNLLCVIRYASILHSITRGFLRQLVGETWWACKIYEFSFSFRVISSWITLFWMFERSTCVSRRLRIFCHRCSRFHLTFILPIILMILILTAVIGPPIYMYEPGIITQNGTSMACYLNSNVSIAWQIYFNEFHLGSNHFTVRCLFSEMIPTGAVILFNIYIVYHIVRTYRYLHRTNHRRPNRRQIQTTCWMNVILLLHSSLFLASLFCHIIGHILVIEAHEAWWVLLSVLINCSLNFYVYCLSGKAFRSEIRRFFLCCRM